MLPTARRLNRLAIVALAAATVGFPAAALIPAASGDAVPRPRITPVRTDVTAPRLSEGYQAASAILLPRAG